MTKTQSQHYLEVVFKDVPRSMEPALSHWLFRHGCWGTHEKIDFVQKDLRYEPEAKLPRLMTLSAYFDPQLREEIEAPVSVWLKEHSPSASLVWKLEEHQDWLKEWKKYFKPLKIGDLTVVPSWEAKKKKWPKKSLFIEPGMAFGTGTHATTRFAVQMIQKLSFEGLTVLDVGAGSGILSVVAEKQGAKRVVAMDIDPESWRECHKLFKLNKTKVCEVSPKALGQIKGAYNVVIANIIDGILMDLKNDLWSKLKPQGHLILSGILTDGSRAFEESFLDGTTGRVLHRIQDEEWTSLLVSK